MTQDSAHADLIAACEAAISYIVGGCKGPPPIDLLRGAVARTRCLPADTTAEQLRQVRDGVLRYRNGIWEMPQGDAIRWDDDDAHPH